MAVHQKANADQTNEAARKRQVEGPVEQAPLALTLDPEVLQRAVTSPGRATPADILSLQRAVGNRAVTRLIQPFSALGVQPKLMVGPVGDRYEREADRVAGRVLTMPAPVGVRGSRGAEEQGSRGARERGRGGQAQPALWRQAEEEELQMKPLAASITPLVQPFGNPSTALRTGLRTQRQVEEEEEELQMKPLLQRQAEEEEEELQMKPAAGVQRQPEEEEEELQMKPALQRAAADGGFEAGDDVESRLASLSGEGSPLPDETRADMEARFGADFSGVRVHSDGPATELTHTLQAKAFTHGRDVYFGAGQYDPGSGEGKRLLAHELTHVVQQTGGQMQQGSKNTVKPKIAGTLSRSPSTAIQRVNIMSSEAFKKASEKDYHFWQKRPQALKNIGDAIDGYYEAIKGKDQSQLVVLFEANGKLYAIQHKIADWEKGKSQPDDSRKAAVTTLKNQVQDKIKEIGDKITKIQTAQADEKRMSARGQNILTKKIKSITDDHARADAIFTAFKKYVRDEGYTYVTEGKGDLLINSEAGSCIQYSSALAALFRAAGIEATNKPISDKCFITIQLKDFIQPKCQGNFKLSSETRYRTETFFFTEHWITDSAVGKYDPTTGLKGGNIESAIDRPLTGSGFTESKKAKFPDETAPVQAYIRADDCKIKVKKGDIETGAGYVLYK